MVDIANLKFESGAKAKVRVLVVDDDEAICESLALVMKQEGYVVRSVLGGKEAQDILKSEVREFHVLWVDLYMTGVGGRELVRAAMDNNPKMRVIVMTGRPSVETDIDVAIDGAWKYLVKPFTAPQVRHLMNYAAFLVLADF